MLLKTMFALETTLAIRIWVKSSLTGTLRSPQIDVKNRMDGKVGINYPDIYDLP
jgi:hypothetical protein